VSLTFTSSVTEQQLTSSEVFVACIAGLVIVYTLDEVAFIQNLVFYITSAYRTPVSKEV